MKKQRREVDLLQPSFAKLRRPFSLLPYLLRPSSRTIVLPRHQSPISSVGRCRCRCIFSPLKTPASSLHQPSPPPLAAACVLLPRRSSRLPRRTSSPLRPASTSSPSFLEAVTTSTPPQLGCHSPFFSRSSLLLHQDTLVSAAPPCLASLSPPSCLHSSSSARPGLNPTSFMKPAFTKLRRLSPARPSVPPPNSTVSNQLLSSVHSGQRLPSTCLEAFDRDTSSMKSSVSFLVSPIPSLRHARALYL